MTCKLTDHKLIIAPQEPGKPPNWVPYMPHRKVVWVDRVLFDQLKACRYDKPCDICPDEIKKWCTDEEKS
ncbi:hypothetical protein KA005_55880 [bacterium]|nr:hypothetical protein [bacterium]